MNSLAQQRRRRIPTPAIPPASRWALVGASILALALAACSSGTSSASLTPTSPAQSGPAASSPAASSPAGSAGASAGGLQISAQGIQYSTKQLQAPAGQAFSITFQNNDSGIPHNVDILDTNNTSVFKGDVFPGVAAKTYQVPALKAGTYGFICDVHPTLMTGTLTVG